ncbi:bifunctional 2-polyprenyl-6-hydroxyphenol methylase/3-demethylubiquinol 3-O-methyltransferase UbiG [Streptomyces sp. ADI95-16]|uniref:class I SAM-dependent methyltransferase n=2 Tax=Streptomyces TaxID=1883 RepID=UPI001E5ADC83|nr:methyltransferase domain-containing protein [Streptomyces sp. ADI95-16]
MVTGGAGRTAVEVGCGTGRFAHWLHHAHGYHVTGLDLPPHNLRLARLRGQGTGLSYAAHDAETGPPPRTPRRRSGPCDSPHDHPLPARPSTAAAPGPRPVAPPRRLPLPPSAGEAVPRRTPGLGGAREPACLCGRLGQPTAHGRRPPRPPSCSARPPAEPATKDTA